MAEPSAYYIYYGFTGLIVLLALAAGKRAFCHYICWMAPFMVAGLKLKDACVWPSLHLVADPGNCTQCGRCAANCPMSLDVRGMVQQGRIVNSDCILCGECVDGCSRGVLHYSFHNQKKHRRSASPAGPRILPQEK